MLANILTELVWPSIRHVVLIAVLSIVAGVFLVYVILPLGMYVYDAMRRQ